MAFTTVCPTCGTVYRLLRKYQDRKIMCDDCRRPFVAFNAHLDALVLPDGVGALPAQGWLLVCPACGHTEVAPAEGQPRTHCLRCGSALGRPVTPSKRIRRR